MPDDPYGTHSRHLALLAALCPTGGNRWDALGCALTSTLAGLREWEYVVVTGETGHRTGRPAMAQVRREPEGFSVETRTTATLPVASPLTTGQEITLTRIGLAEHPEIGVWRAVVPVAHTAAALAVDVLTEVWAVPEAALVRVEAAGWAPEPAPALDGPALLLAPPDVSLLVATVDALWATL